MTLNYSSRAIFPTASPFPRLPPEGGGFIPSFFREENYNWEFFTTPMDCEKGGGGAFKPLNDDGFSFETDLALFPPGDDIVDLLPSDPFGMGLADSDTWNAAIAGWIEDLAASAVDNVGYYEYGDYYPRVDNLFDYVACRGSMNSEDTATSLSSEIWTFGSPLCSSSETDNSCGGGVPHDALLFALSYMDIPDLLSVERVCKTMCTAIRGDSFLWRHVHVNPPLSKNVTDNALIQLTDRAKGSLECLSLTECSQITNNGLNYILEKNPKLKKLNITGCMRLNIEGVVDILKQRKSRIQNLSINGLYGITHEHLLVLNGLLGPDLDTSLQREIRKPLFYHLRRNTSCGNMAAVDVEECPKCHHVRVLYDCPISNCQAPGLGLCRACSICIVRCDQCGKCINGQEFEETFALDCVCLSCMNCIHSVQQLGESCLKIAT